MLIYDEVALALWRVRLNLVYMLFYVENIFVIPFGLDFRFELFFSLGFVLPALLSVQCAPQSRMKFYFNFKNVMMAFRSFRFNAVRLFSSNGEFFFKFIMKFSRGRDCLLACERKKNCVLHFSVPSSTFCTTSKI